MINLRRLALIVFLPLLLAACGAESKWATDAAVSQAVYRPGGQPTITFYTVVNNKTGSGAHEAMLINASQRVMFDPAGTFNNNDHLPERNDVLYGMDDNWLVTYIDYHTRVEYRTIVQEVPVSAETAELALQLAQSYGAVPKAHCTASITAIVQQLPGFEGIKRTYFPMKMMEQVARTLPVSRAEVIYDDDPANEAPMRYEAFDLERELKNRLIPAS